MAGGTVNNQLQRAAEETTAAATVTAAETVEMEKTVFSEGRTIFWCQYNMLFLAGVVRAEELLFNMKMTS
jgi:hypothetical protein